MQQTYILFVYFIHHFLPWSGFERKNNEKSNHQLYSKNNTHKIIKTVLLTDMHESFIIYFIYDA